MRWISSGPPDITAHSLIVRRGDLIRVEGAVPHDGDCCFKRVIQHPVNISDLGAERVVELPLTASAPVVAVCGLVIMTNLNCFARKTKREKNR